MNEINAIVYYYLTASIIGLAVWPVASKAFSSFPDRGWILAKTLGLLFISYITWMLAITKLVKFSYETSLVVLIILGLVNWVWYLRTSSITTTVKSFSLRNFATHQLFRLVMIEEIIFIIMFLFWTLVRAYNPDIFGLEKYMDYGFILSILRADYFPPLDHFFAQEGINYYYFGHLTAAVLTQLSKVPPNITYNLQVAYLFAMSFMSSFTVAAALIFHSLKTSTTSRTLIMGGVISGGFTAVVGNLHAALNIFDYKEYWYAAASRLIPFTINEFPVYSFVVADLHAHVNNLPTTILIIGLITNLTLTFRAFFEKADHETPKELTYKQLLLPSYALLPLTLGASYASNSWDFAIYHLLFASLVGYCMFFIVYQHTQPIALRIYNTLETSILVVAPVFILSVVLFTPFWRTVAPIGKGIGAVYTFSPVSLVLILWGMYFFLGGSFALFALNKPLSRLLYSLVRKFSKVKIFKNWSHQILNFSSRTGSFTPSIIDKQVLLMMAVALMLIIIPEIIYVKDIYPQHYRANTMFKLYYGAWVLFSIAAAYSFTRMVRFVKEGLSSNFWVTNVLLQYVFIAATLLYPYLAINTVTGGFKFYDGLDGTKYLETKLPYDAQAIDWINSNIDGQPTILEAVGDSYTEYARVASNTGLPTVMGWPVHEWLWRGTWDSPVEPQSRVLTEYGTDTVATRVGEVGTIYTSENREEVTQLLEKYQVDYIYLGELEIQKYPNLSTEKLISLGNVVYQNEKVFIIKYTD